VALATRYDSLNPARQTLYGVFNEKGNTSCFAMLSQQASVFCTVVVAVQFKNDGSGRTDAVMRYVICRVAPADIV
jgi:hypothetical protein